MASGKRTPKYRKSTNRDLGFVESNGKRHYLPGRYNSAESLAAYHRFVASGLLVVPVREVSHFVGQIVAQYREYAAAYYPTGTRSEYANIVRATRTLAQHAAMYVEHFGPRVFRELMEQLHAAGKSREYVNGIASRIKRMFRWAASVELVDVTIYQALATVPGLRGRDRLKRTGVPWAHVLPVFAYLTPTVQAMLWLQVYTGARSGSICQARAEQFDLRGDPWLWRPRHKTEYRGAEVVLPIGPRCRQRIWRFLMREGFLFVPAQPHKKRGDPRYRDHYDATTYRQALSRAQAQAGVPAWTPHQLRHARGQSVRRVAGVEAAQAVLGHARVDATQLYAGRQLTLAVEFASLHG